MSNHLTCHNHKRRVHVIPTGAIVHRNDGSKCESFLVKIGELAFTPKEILENKQQVLVPPVISPSEMLDLILSYPTKEIK